MEPDMPKPVGRARNLTREQLERLAARTQELLYVDLAPDSFDDDCELDHELRDAGITPASDFWNPDKAREADDPLDGIAGILGEYGLVPEAPQAYHQD